MRWSEENVLEIKEGVKWVRWWWAGNSNRSCVSYYRKDSSCFGIFFNFSIIITNCTSSRQTQHKLAMCSPFSKPVYAIYMDCIAPNPALCHEFHTHSQQHMVCRQPKGVKRKMRRQKLQHRVNWHGALQQEVIKQTGIKQGLPVCVCVNIYNRQTRNVQYKRQVAEEHLFANQYHYSRIHNTFCWWMAAKYYS